MFKNSVKFAVLVLVLATFVWGPSASALPRQCDEVCTCSTSCTVKCAIGGWVTTCGFDGICIGMCFNAADTSADSEESFLASLAQDEAEPVVEAPAAPAATPAR